MAIAVEETQRGGYSSVVENAVRESNFDGTKMYDAENVLTRLSALPSYVSEAMERRVKDDTTPHNYDKVVLDKWGRKSSASKKFAETPEMVFYRAALLAADGLKQHDPSVDYRTKVRGIFDKFVGREIYPNTPYMANGGHGLMARELEEALADVEVSSEMRNDVEQEKVLAEQLFACFVLGIYDSRKSIFRTMENAGEIQANTGGTGFNFSYLRPGGEIIHSTGGLTDGPVSFMAAYSHVLGKTMNQGGKREGANMFMLNSDHPDIMRFLYAKREDGEIPAANVSVAIDHPFMEAVKSKNGNSFYPLKNPHYNPKTRPHVPKFYSVDQLRSAIDSKKMNDKAVVSLELSEDGMEVLSPWLHEGVDEEYRTIGKVGEDGVIYLDAKKVLRHLAYNSWFNGEPGIIVTGHINDHNPTHPRHYKRFLVDQTDPEAVEVVGRLRKENPDVNIETLVDDYVLFRDDDGRFVHLPIGVGEIRATNPCGEKPLLENEACVLGHTNLEKILVASPEAASGYTIDWNRFEENTRLMYDILDNAIDQNHFTLPEIEVTQKSNRKIGVGFMGLANMLYKLEIPYNTEGGRQFVDELLTFWERISDEASFEKGERFGTFPNFNYSHHADGRKKRNAIVRTLAPTGTTGFVAQTTGGMEPEYALTYTRKTVQGTKVVMINSVLNEKLEKYPIFNSDTDKDTLANYLVSDEGAGSLRSFEIQKEARESEESFARRQGNLRKIKEIFVTTYDITPRDHILMEAVVQDHVDDAISKTTNFRKNATVEDVEEAFVLAYEKGIKGITFYRDGTRKGQPLQVKKEGKLEEVKVIHEPYRGTIENPANLPGIMPAVRIRQRTPFGNMFVKIVVDPYDNYRALETFGSLGDSGDQEFASMEGIGKQTSMWLRSGGDLEQTIHLLEGIGSGHSISTRGGTVKSLEMAFAKAGIKFELARRKIPMELMLTGNVDLDQFDEEVDDLVRRYSGEKGSWRTYDSENGETEDKFEEGELLSVRKNQNQNGNKTKAFKVRCTFTSDCPGTMIQEEGCMRCKTCGGTRC